MKIVFVTPEYPTFGSGGIATFYRTLGIYLAKQGHEVTVLLPGHGRQFEDQGVQVCFLNQRNIPKLGWLATRVALQRRIQELAQGGMADIVEAPDWCGLTAGLCVRPPLLIRCHGSGTYFSHIMGQRVKTKTYLEEKIALQRADGIVAVSRYCAEHTARFFRLRREPQVIYNGVDTSLYHPTEKQPSVYPVVLVVGTIVRKKGCLDLPKIINAIGLRNAVVQFRIIGRDAKDDMTRVSSMIRVVLNGIHPEVRNRVQYFGEQPAEVVRREMGAATVCLFPSYAEALPISWLEAMACGCPVVGYDAGWAREIIEVGSDGFLVAPGDVEAMARVAVELISNATLHREVGLQARRKVERSFTLQACAEHTVEWYRTFLE